FCFAQKEVKIRFLDFQKGTPISGVRVSSYYGLSTVVSDENGFGQFLFKPDAPLLAPSLNFEKEGWLVPNIEDVFRDLGNDDTLVIYITEEDEFMKFQKSLAEGITSLLDSSPLLELKKYDSRVGYLYQLLS